MSDVQPQQIPDTCETQSSVAHVLSREERDALTPDDVLNRLRKGNDRFAAGLRSTRDLSRQVADAARGQSPMAVVLSCLDSRIPVEEVFDQGIGDVFVARVAGNFENTDILGSMEFACLPQQTSPSEPRGGGGAKLVFVLGHESCGAVEHAIDGTEAGNITAMLENIKPAIEDTAYDGDRSSRNGEFVSRVAINNVRWTINRIRRRSQILREMEERGEIRIVGGFYRIGSGRVDSIAE